MNPKVNIKFWRELRKMSQKTLSKQLNISQGYISAIEANKKSPTIRMLYRIAGELNVCPRLLLNCIIECKMCIKGNKCVCVGDNNEGCNI